MNLVVISSLFKVYMSTTIYNENERKIQIKNSIKTIREKIPSSYIVLLEGGTATNEDILDFSTFVDEFIIIDIKSLPKSIGEFKLLYTYFNSELFKSKQEQFKTISKFSGRYYLNDNFVFNESICFKYREHENQGIVETRYYRFPITYLNIFLQKLEIINQDTEFLADNIDIEHLFAKHMVLPLHYATIDSKIGVSGNNAPSGIAIED